MSREPIVIKTKEDLEQFERFEFSDCEDFESTQEGYLICEVIGEGYPYFVVYIENGKLHTNCYRFNRNAPKTELEELRERVHELEFQLNLVSSERDVHVKKGKKLKKEVENLESQNLFLMQEKARRRCISCGGTGKVPFWGPKPVNCIKCNGTGYE